MKGFPYFISKARLYSHLILLINIVLEVSARETKQQQKMMRPQDWKRRCKFTY